MRETKEISIDGRTFRVTQLGAIQGRKVFTRLAKVLASGANGSSSVAGMIASIAEKLDPADVDYLCDVFGASSSVQLEPGKDKYLPVKDVFDLEFAGKYMNMVRWLGFCLEVNFGSFLADIGLSTDNLQARVVSQLSSPKEQTGPSGAS